MKDIYKLTAADAKSLQERVLKLSEEAGELAQAVLSYSKAPGSIYKQHTIEDVREEAVDTAIVALSVLAQTFENEADFRAELDRLMAEKCTKWRATLTAN